MGVAAIGSRWQLLSQKVGMAVATVAVAGGTATQPSTPASHSQRLRRPLQEKVKETKPEEKAEESASQQRIQSQEELKVM